jgi:hypothetical protein
MGTYAGTGSDRPDAFQQVSVAIGLLFPPLLVTLPGAFAFGDRHVKTHTRVVVIGGGVMDEPWSDLSGTLIGRAAAGYYGHILGESLGYVRRTR